jgi:hypothetical protein
LDIPTPAPAQEEEAPVSISDLDLDDSAERTPENMKLLLARAKRAGRAAAKKTKMAYDTTKALADSGALRTTRFRKKRSNGTA